MVGTPPLRVKMEEQEGQRYARPRNEPCSVAAGAFCREDENVEDTVEASRGIGADSRSPARAGGVSAVTVARYGAK